MILVKKWVILLKMANGLPDGRLRFEFWKLLCEGAIGALRRCFG
jgi:hypothetical protein